MRMNTDRDLRACAHAVRLRAFACVVAIPAENGGLRRRECQLAEMVSGPAHALTTIASCGSLPMIERTVATRYSTCVGQRLVIALRLKEVDRCSTR